MGFYLGKYKQVYLQDFLPNIFDIHPLTSAAERKLEKELATYEPTQIVKLTGKGSRVTPLRERYSRLYINWISTFIQ